MGWPKKTALERPGEMPYKPVLCGKNPLALRRGHAGKRPGTEPSRFGQAMLAMVFLAVVVLAGGSPAVAQQDFTLEQVPAPVEPPTAMPPSAESYQFRDPDQVIVDPEVTTDVLEDPPANSWWTRLNPETYLAMVPATIYTFAVADSWRGVSDGHFQNNNGFKKGINAGRMLPGLERFGIAAQLVRAMVCTMGRGDIRIPALPANCNSRRS